MSGSYLLWILLCFSWITCVWCHPLLSDCVEHYGTQQHGLPPLTTYTRVELLSLRTTQQTLSHHVDIPFECRKHNSRGKRAGVRVKSRNRKSRPFAPQVVFGNVRSIANKIDELRGNCRYLHEYREACILGLTETWLTPDINDGFVDVNGFKIIRSDRTSDSGKCRGGGVALYINERWANNISIKDNLCTPDVELLSVSVRPFYLPREFSNIFITIIYSPPDANKEVVMNTVHEHVNKMTDSKPDALHLLFGDMNNCGTVIGNVLNGFQQCVDCCTRNTATLDLFFCNVKNCYKCYQMPPLKSSDHVMLRMLPIYKPKLKQTKPTEFNRQSLDTDCIDKLNACFDLTDWDLFITDAQGDVNKLVDLVTSYVSFCRDLHLTKKVVKRYPNNKPWITPHLRQLIVDKHKSYSKENYHDKQVAVDKEIMRAKDEYRQKIEGLFQSGDPKDAWRGLKVLLGSDKKRNDPAIICTPGSADRLNKFYARFDKQDFSKEHLSITDQLRSESGDLFSLPEDNVHKALSMIKIKKASGPDNLSGKLIKSCRYSLFYVIHKIFEMSLASSVFPSVWKIGEVIPVAKKPLPKVDNDLRPVTLTSILSKCLERVGLSLLKPYVIDKLDNLQFAYSPKRSTDDAVCTLVHQLTKHLDAKSGYTARATFIDYSSAFNTIQPHILVRKLNAMNVPGRLVLWILDYMTKRPQYVKTQSETSETLTLNTGAPQGCVLSPFLFILYTNDLSWNSEKVFIQKYADDTVILGRVKEDNDAEYRQCVEFVNTWANNNYLHLNVSKTKEMIWDFRKSCLDSAPIKINNSEVEIVSAYKYLGLIIDDRLSFEQHVKSQIKKANKRLYHIRAMRSIKVSPHIIAMFYNATIPSVLMYTGVAFYGMLTQALKEDLHRPYRICEKIAGPDCQLQDNETIHNKRLKSMTDNVMRDDNHPLHSEFCMLPSGRRLRVIRTRTERYRHSFVPTAVRLWKVNKTL